MPFSKIETKIEGLFILETKSFGDSRGYFMETYQKNNFSEMGINDEFVQDNFSCSSKGVLRGLHFQKEPYAQAKLVRVTKGTVWDVGVDLRPESPTYGKWEGVILSGENKRMFYLPAGFAHGFITLEDDTHFQYKCTNYFAPEYDGGIRWNDPDIAVKWPIPESMTHLVSEKDAKLPFLKDIK